MFDRVLIAVDDDYSLPIADSGVPDAIGEAAEDDVFESMASRAHEFIKDKVNELTWEEMQELVAGLLRSLGYKTRVSEVGPDRGKDIVASPDGFGFEAPRIVVEVKHRKGAMGAPEVRSFLGGRNPQDKGLYVSTGGFTREARYEAEKGGSVCVNSFGRLAKWISSSIMLLPGLASAR